MDTAVTNAEDDPASLMRIFPGLMKKDAMHWLHNDLTPAVRADWNLLSAAFLNAFRKEKSMSRIMARLRSIKMKDMESIRRYARRVRVLLNKINPAPSAEMQAEYFIGGLPRAMNKYVRQQSPATIAAAIELSQKYVDVEQSQEKELRKEERDEARRSKKKKHRKKHLTSSEESDVSSSSGSSGDSATTASSSQPSSEDDFRTRRRKETRKSTSKTDKDSKTQKHFQKTIDELAGKFDKLAVNLADNRTRRRSAPLQRPGVWCSQCQQRGHYPAECTADLRYLEAYEDQEEFLWTDEMEESQWRMVQSQGPQRPPLNRPQGIGRGTGPMGTKPIYRPPMEPPGGFPDPNAPRVKGTCYNCGDPRHYSPNCPWPKAPKQIPILCGNCGQQGHTPLECPNPARPKLLVKYVKDPDVKEEAEARLVYIEEATAE